jgi:hypothetical protein
MAYALSLNSISIFFDKQQGNIMLTMTLLIVIINVVLFYLISKIFFQGSALHWVVSKFTPKH